jgi:peptide/nickel transport system substrate-binding protein
MLAVSGAATIPLVQTACGTSESTASTPTSGDAASTAGGTLVIDSTFGLKTADLARNREFSGELLAHNVYEDATTFAGIDPTNPIPRLTDFAWSSDHRTLTRTLHGEHHFLDASPVTVADIAFSYGRVQGIEGSPAFLLDGVTVTQVDDSRVTLTTKAPNLALPAILANP